MITTWEEVEKFLWSRGRGGRRDERAEGGESGSKGAQTSPNQRKARAGAAIKGSRKTLVGLRRRFRGWPRHRWDLRLLQLATCAMARFVGAETAARDPAERGEPREESGGGDGGVGPSMEHADLPWLEITFYDDGRERRAGTRERAGNCRQNRAPKCVYVYTIVLYNSRDMCPRWDTT